MTAVWPTQKLLRMSMKINDAFVKEVRNLQESMLKPAHSMFLESETDDLSCVIRLTVEFLHHIQEIDSMDRSEIRYLCESIFSGVESFCVVAAAIRSAWGEQSSAPPEGATVASVKADFQRRCGLLLDLFKLQIVFAGLSY